MKINSWQRRHQSVEELIGIYQELHKVTGSYKIRMGIAELAIKALLMTITEKLLAVTGILIWQLLQMQLTEMPRFLALVIGRDVLASLFLKIQACQVQQSNQVPELQLLNLQKLSLNHRLVKLLIVHNQPRVTRLYPVVQ